MKLEYDKDLDLQLKKKKLLESEKLNASNESKQKSYEIYTII